MYALYRDDSGFKVLCCKESKLLQIHEFSFDIVDVLQVGTEKPDSLYHTQLPSCAPYIVLPAPPYKGILNPGFGAEERPMLFRRGNYKSRSFDRTYPSQHRADPKLFHNHHHRHQALSFRRHTHLINIGLCKKKPRANYRLGRETAELSTQKPVMNEL